MHALSFGALTAMSIASITAITSNSSGETVALRFTGSVLGNDLASGPFVGVAGGSAAELVLEYDTAQSPTVAFPTLALYDGAATAVTLTIDGVAVEVSAADLATFRLGVQNATTDLFGVSNATVPATAGFRIDVTLIDADGATLAALDLPAGLVLADFETRIWKVFETALPSTTELVIDLEVIEVVGDDLDSDGDGLTDAEEVALAGGSGCPDPFDFDSDQDGLLDGDEILAGTDPCVPTDVTPPSAAAGDDQSVHAGDLVLLDGSLSNDDFTASEDLVYAWSLVSAPAGSIAAATLIGADTALPMFIADLDGTFELQLVVSDEAGLDSAPDVVQISSLNAAPTADAGVDRVVVVTTPATLDGSASSDPDGDPLTFTWSLVEAPPGSAAVISGATAEYASLIPDLTGTYTATLVVDDGLITSPAAEVTVTAISGADFAEVKLQEVSLLVSSLPVESFRKENDRKKLLKSVSKILKHLQKDDLDKAKKKLVKVIAEVDGCVLRGDPDTAKPFKKDRIVECDDQAAVYDVLLEAFDAAW